MNVQPIINFARNKGFSNFKINEDELDYVEKKDIENLVDNIQRLTPQEKLLFKDYTFTNDDYNNVTSFQDLINMNISFLRGIRLITYYHLGVIDPETIPLLGDLVEINKRGFYSTGGQPGEISSDVNQKSFIEGNLLTSDNMSNYRFKDYLFQNNDYYYHMIYPSGKVYSNVPFNEKGLYNLTREFNPDRDYTNLNSAMTFPLAEIPAVDNILGNTVYIIFVAKEYGPQYSVEKLLLNFPY